MEYLRKLILGKNMNKEKQELIDKLNKIQKEKEEIAKDRDWAYGGCGVREEEIKWLKLDKQKLEKEMLEVNKENQRVYQGHAGLMEEINFLKFRVDETSKLHDEVVERHWVNDESRKKYTCLYPFERIEILPRGEVYTCCSAYLKHNYYIGNIYKDSFEEIWNSEEAKRLRYSVSIGNFEYCTHKCKWLHLDQNSAGGETATLNPIRERNEYNFTYKAFDDCSVSQSPKFVTLTCDDTCNLSCPSCRNNVKALANDESNVLYQKLMENVRPLLINCELLGALASGEFFASKALIKFYKTLTHEEFPKLKLYIITNAQLLTQKNLDNLKNLQNIPIRLGVSVDATKKDTYEKLRRGGSWEILCENMSHIAKIKNTNSSNIEFLCLHFVVQKENYLQMKDFIQLGIKWNADTVEFQRMGNWGTVETEEYLQNDVFHPQNEHYIEAKEMLQDLIDSTNEIKIVQNIL